MLAAEVLALTTIYDAYPLAEALPVLRCAGPIVGLGVVFLTTLLLSARLRPRVLRVPLEAPRGGVLVAALVAHAGAFALLFPAIRALLATPDAPRLLFVSGLFLALVGSAAAVALRPASWGALLRARRQDLGAAFVVAFAAWGAGLLAEELWYGLADVTLVLVVVGLGLVASGRIVTEAEARMVGLDDFLVEIAPVCSGMEGLGLIAVLTLAWLVVRRRELRFPQALLLVPLGLVAVYAANVVRIVALILLGARVDPEVALGGFHSKAGWLFFCLIAFALLALAERSSFFVASREEEGELEYPAAPYLAPLLAWMGTAMGTGLFAAGIDRLYGFRLVVAALVLARFRPTLPLRRAAPAPGAIGLGLVTFALWFLLHPEPPAEDVEALRAGFDALSPFEASGWLLVRVVGSVLVVPLVEELAFRGFLLRRLVAADFLAVPLTTRRALPVLLSSLAFGLTHQSVVAGTVAGVLFAYAQSARGRTEDAIVAHAVANAAVAAAVLFADQWWLWS
ncbi:MAG: exosortase E/protease, VPEID-CTERM system [Myxococcota bacterium]